MAPSHMSFEDWLDDLCVRFINNLPEADLTSMARICFLVEEAHWFYEDFIRPLDSSLPSMNLRSFCLLIFQRSPLLAPFPIEDHVRAFEEFLKYKTSVPVRGAILLNDRMDHALLVKGWKKGANWSFPRGKISMNEDDLDCAIREVAEETGYDVREAGIVPPPEDIKYIETTFRDQQLRLYVFRGVPMTTHFEPRTRKEISKIQWYRIADLPSYRKRNNNPATDADNPAQSAKFYMVAPFIGPLRKWVAYQRKQDAYRAGDTSLAPQLPVAEEGLTEDEAGAPPEPSFRSYQGNQGDQGYQGYQGYQNGAPEGILDNATRELQRLLKLPPTGGAPVSGTMGSADPGQKKATALLAMLQTGDRPPSGPHTPLDHTYDYNQAPPPHAPHHPHHQQVQYGPYGSYPQQGQQHRSQQQPPPPPFHLHMPPPGQGQEGAQYNTYGGPRPNQQQQNPQQRPPQMPQISQQSQYQPQNYAYQPQPQSIQQMQPPGPPTQQQQQQQQQYPVQDQRQYTPNYGNQPGLYPFPGQAPQQQPIQQQVPRPPVQLLHPQPLPPTVQKGLLARESFASPDVNESGRRAAGGYGNAGGPLPPQQPQQPQQQQNTGHRQPLSSHAATLLSSFKSQSSPRVDGGQGIGGGAPAAWPQQQQGPPQQQQQQQQKPQPQPQQAPPPSNGQQHGGAPLGQLYGVQPQTYDGPNGAFHGHEQQVGPPVGPPAGNHGAPRPRQLGQPGPAMDSHRNALLGIFKQPQPSQQPQQPQQIQQIQQIQPQQQQPPPTSTQTPVEIDGAPIVGGVTLPFGAMSLLTRPKGSETGGVPRPMQQQPQSQPPQQQHQHQQYSAVHPPQVARRPDNGDHKQKLLSLFGKPQMSPTASASSRASMRDTNGPGLAPPPPPPLVTNAASVSASIASDSSRRGSAAQTPISLADRSFLLGYLASATK